MGEQVTFVCRVAQGADHVSTVTVCWCDARLGELLKQGKLESVLKEGASGEDVRALHDHLVCFNFDLELMKTAKGGAPAQSEDQKGSKWGKYTTRALRMFALHPAVGSEPEKVLKTEGKKVTKELAEKLQLWCRNGTRSPKNYWEFRQLRLDGKEQLVDAYGDDLGHGPQSAWHHHIRQIQEDLSKVGFGVHADDICGLGAKASPTGKYVKDVKSDKGLTDLQYLVRKFQRQSRWFWRMKADGTHLPDLEKEKGGATDKTVYQHDSTGVMDYETAQVLRAWVDGGLHMVIKKFELKELHWPPDSTTVITSDSGHAKLRKDAYEAWYEAAKLIHEKGGTLGTNFASSPRGYAAGKLSSSKGNSPYSWHYSALAVDIDQSPAHGDGTINAKRGVRFILEEDGDKFRVWCYADPQPAVPTDPAQDLKDPYLQYRNRNIATKSAPPGKKIKATEPSDPAPLFHLCDASAAFAKVAAPAGWYVDVSRIMEENGMMRIPRHKNWQTQPKAWEWWHYQYQPAPPPSADAKPKLTFGDYLQLFGVHEYKLRNVGDGWPDHSDIEKPPA